MKARLNSGNLDRFTAYQKAVALFDLVVDDMGRYLRSRELERLVSQQISSSDSV